METPDINTSLSDLPFELISLILEYTDPPDIIRFGATSKHFHEIVSNNHFLWKKKFSRMVPKEVIKLIFQHNDGDWLKETIHFYNLKHRICMELLGMPAAFYWRVLPVSITDVEVFFLIATENKLNYFYTIYILQAIVHKGNQLFNINKCVEPLYTLTVVYYAKVVLKYLLHTYLPLKWLQKRDRNQLTPTRVVNFFMQWLDVTKIYRDEIVEYKIQSVIKRVKKILYDTYPNRRHIAGKKYTDKELMLAVTKAIYYNNTVSTEVYSSSLDIVKVIDEKHGSVITYAAICHEVANRFGLKCELIAFTNHLFLDWQSVEEPGQQYSIDPFNGEIKIKRRICPYSNATQTIFKYKPDTFLHFISTSYKDANGRINNCETKNARCLRDHSGLRFGELMIDKHFFQNLLKYFHARAIETPLNMLYMDDVHLETMLVLSRLNFSEEENEEVVSYRKVVVKQRTPQMKYAVGMICYHTEYHYFCVIRGWEENGHHLEVLGVDHLRGRDEPLYYVLAGDKSNRLVSQIIASTEADLQKIVDRVDKCSEEAGLDINLKKTKVMIVFHNVSVDPNPRECRDIDSLKQVARPFRMHDLEERLALEFTHFDGVFYVPNEEKTLEYPEEAGYNDLVRKAMLYYVMPNMY